MMFIVSLCVFLHFHNPIVTIAVCWDYLLPSECEEEGKWGEGGLGYYPGSVGGTLLKGWVVGDI